MDTPRCLILASLVFTFATAHAAEAATSASAGSALPTPLPTASATAPKPEPTYLLNGPRGLAVDKDGVIYVGDIGNNAVFKMTQTGKILLLAGGPASSSEKDGLGSAAGFASPTGLAVGKDGNVYVADGDNNTIRKITPAGLVTTLAGKAGESGTADGKGAAARFNGATGVAVDKDGNVFVADTHNGSVRKITPEGTVTTLTSKPSDQKRVAGKSTAVELSSPRAIAVDGAGVVYIADESLGIVCKVAPDGMVTVIAGDANAAGSSKDGVGTKAAIIGPRGLAVDAKGNLYVADTDEGTIRKITPDGTVTTLAGEAGVNGSANGKGGAAHFSGPRGLAVDKDGNVYVADTDNAVIRKITPDGTVTTMGMAVAQPKP